MTNSYPIVFIHGFCGWGNDRYPNFRYWGGLNGDICKLLEDQGFKVFALSLGPFTSNWDRCCEAYAKIKGGTVDYGEKHSSVHKHLRYGRTYEGIYPEWGDLREDGTRNKIHLIGHSVGGQTVRMFAQLLGGGCVGADPEEDPNSHSLFKGGKGWVHSVTTISSPNCGTVLSDGLAENGTNVKKAIISMVSLLNSFGDVYDPYLDQWGITPRQQYESLEQYANRIMLSPVFQSGYLDTALASSTTEGAKSENKWVKTLSNIYYFSFSTIDSHSSRDLLLRRIHRPNLLTMFPSMQPFGSFIGGRYGVNHGLTEEWQANDGIVNTISMKSDGSPTRDLVDMAKRGIWNTLPLIEKIDHCEIVGIPFITDAVEDLFSAHAVMLAALPKTVDMSSHTKDIQGKATRNLLLATANLYSCPLKMFDEHIQDLLQNDQDKITYNVFPSAS